MSHALATAPAATAVDLPSVVGADLQVPLVDGRCVRYANLDVAASAPALQAVADEVNALLPWYASVHRGAGYASQVCTRVLEAARTTVAEFVGARPGDVTVFTRHTTDSLNLLASCVPGPVLTLDVEHHANLLPWQSRPGSRVIAARAGVDATLAAVDDALARGSFALLAVTGASNVTGETLPIAQVVDIAHAYGTRVVVDAAQTAPHRRIDLAAWGADYVALSGHKLYAPYGTGALVGRRDWLDEAAPHLAGGGAVAHVGIHGTTAEAAWAPAPHRHEAGTPNVLGAAALAAACRTLAPLLDEVAPAHERALLTRLTDGLDAIDGVTSLRIWNDSPDRVAVASFVVDGVPAGLVAAYLSAEHGIGVRDGRFCAHPLLARLADGGDGAGDGNAVRASLGLGSTAEDVDRLLSALTALVAEGPRWDYAVVDGRWAPTPDPRDADPLGLAGPVGTQRCGAA
ncbi:selenocysteine lyase/cysteine desulfurase [Pseudonocardia sediminis]|uniref:Selenocysteine lyase/cysteine desulfurase n=1 Tax=Pseudonocardia sediminis TaxID=1397368 RepID=A0A4Q7UXT7_PSEST|nr:aminotransferase class V-fold PLP-dependent enzyme [Pseudonocardia sediminis]RZT84959.1 selenocysteine lyase/cysteine desulfurase [Pseudonocardia sediminis]